MRSVYLIAYDVADHKRRTLIFHKLSGYGESLQYSLFRCRLTPTERLRLRSDLWGLMDHAADRIMLVDLGPEDGRGKNAIECWGNPLNDPVKSDDILIV